MNNVITIGREFGSSGRDIAAKLADSLGYTLYDKELLAAVAKKTGIHENIFQSIDETRTNSFLFTLAINGFHTQTSPLEMPLGDRLFGAMSDVVKKIVLEHPCVIVGRCADYILRDYEKLFSVFVLAPENFRCQRVADLFNLSQKEAHDTIRKYDKKRANFYNYYSGKRWGDASSYNLTIDASIFGVDETTQILKNIALKKFAKQL